MSLLCDPGSGNHEADKMAAAKADMREETTGYAVPAPGVGRGGGQWSVNHHCPGTGNNGIV